MKLLNYHNSIVNRLSYWQKIAKDDERALF